MATTDKYDRQLRLWGANGQRQLMTSHILLIHANGVGAETLKNLVLPGIGQFTILDDYIVNNNDLSCNFFVDPSSVGKPRAEIVRDLLCEMNPDVKGFSRVANFQNILQTEPSFFESFSLIITANLAEDHLLPLASLCFEKNINLVVLRSFGMIGSIRLQLKKHNIIEAKKDQTTFDLRISDSFPELAQFCEKFSLDSLSSIDHSHVPFVVILYQALRNWRNENGGVLPSTPQQKKQFQDSIKALARSFQNEVNFQEAHKEYYYSYKRPFPSDELQRLLDSQKGKQLTRVDDDFSFLLRALDGFLGENNNVIPLAGLLPDMTATTDSYVQLQAIFHNKASQDRALFRSLLHRELEKAGESSARISDDDIEIFTKNCQTIAQIETGSIRSEIVENASAETVRDVLENDLFDDPLQTPIIWYISLRAADAFYQKYGRWPGTKDDLLAHDQEEIFKELKAISESYGLPDETVGDSENTSEMETEPEASQRLLTPAHALEITRYGGSELHNICSVIGGIASQEVVKIITHQYEPFNNTYVFNGIACCGAVYSL